MNWICRMRDTERSQGIGVDNWKDEMGKIVDGTGFERKI